MTRHWLVLLLILTAPVASAQTTPPPVPLTVPLEIRGNPEKAAYASPAEYPFFDAQGHWNPSDAETPFEHITGHLHVGCNIPYMAVITGPFRMSCSLKIFHAAGFLTDTGINNYEHQIRDPIWADTGTSTPPPLVGDLHGLKVYNVSVTYDPRYCDNCQPQAPSRGWGVLKVRSKIRFANKDEMEVFLMASAYFALDPTAPERPFPLDGIIVRSFVQPNTLRRPDLSQYGTQFGAVIAEVRGVLPLVPFSQVKPLVGFFYNYAMLESFTGTFRFPDGTAELRKNPDLHNGIPGDLLFSRVLSSGNTTLIPLTLNPADLGPGNQKILLRWHQPDGQLNDADALLVFPVSVDLSVPPPPTCTAPKVVVNGLCVDPPPPPPVDLCPNLAGVQTTIPTGLVLVNGQCVPPTTAGWQTIQTTGVLEIQQFGATDRRRECIVGGKCGQEFTVPR